MTLKVSNSEAVTAAECERRWMYQYHPEYSLQAVNGNISMDRGTAVHTVLESFFRSLMEGKDYSEAVSMAKNRFVMLVSETAGSKLGEEIMKLRPAFTAYFKYNREQILSWKVLGVELELTANLTDEFVVSGRIDLMVEALKGAFKGETIPIDHKTCYNFWTKNELEMNSQGPIYMHLAKENFPGSVVSRMFFNGIRYREVKDDENLARIVVLDAPKVFREGILDNHIKLMKRIKVWRDTPAAELREQATRSTNPYVCKNCSMRRLCRAELMQQDTTDIIRYEYEPNTYLYEQENSNDLQG